MAEMGLLLWRSFVFLIFLRNGMYPGSVQFVEMRLRCRDIRNAEEGKKQGTCGRRGGPCCIQVWVLCLMFFRQLLPIQYVFLSSLFFGKHLSVWFMRIQETCILGL